MEENKKQFPTPKMLKAREELARMTPEERKAAENSMRAELKKYYEGRPHIGMHLGILEDLPEKEK